MWSECSRVQLGEGEPGLGNLVPWAEAPLAPLPAWDLAQETQVQVFMYFENSSDFFFRDLLRVTMLGSS